MRKCLLALFSIISVLVVVLAAGLVKGRLSTNNSPQWRKQQQGALIVPQGGYVTLQADGMDTSSLQKAVLSTNETGTWRNETTSALLWVQNAVFGFDNFGTATYKDGVLYAPSKGDNKLYAVNATNGDIIWNTTVRQCDGSPCIDGDVVYVGECMEVYGEPTPFARALALNKTNGEEIWDFVEPNNNTWVGSPLVNGEYVYYTTSYDTSYTTGSGVYALNKTNGHVLWRQDIGDIVGSVAYDSGMVFISVYNPPGQYAFNATTGDLIWHQDYGASWDTSPVIYDGMIIQVEVNRTVGVWSTYVLNETNGEFIRWFEAKGSTGTPLVHDGKVFIPSNDWTMWAFDLATGTELWQTVPLHNGTLQNYMYCSPASAGGAIYCQALNGTFYAINETDGGVLWSYTLSSTGFGSPSIGDGCVFITNDGGLYAFKIGPGSGAWPMFCHNNFHSSFSEQGVEYVRWPLTEPQDLGEVSNTWVTAKFTWCNETIASAAIAWRIYFFDSLGNSNATDVKIFFVMPIHDVAVVNIVPDETLIQQNQEISVNVTAANPGNYTETFNVTLYYDSVEIGLQNVTLDTGESRVLTFVWNTTGVLLGNHTLKATTSMVPYEVSTDDNTVTLQSPVTVVPEFPFITTLIAALIACTITVTILTRRKRTRT
ncbi:MAG: PQQ-binding-like beta-propeller repeat protein [Candidatus Bathyarchaeia archaeon]